MTLEKAIKLLKAEHEKAKNQPFVVKHSWKKVAEKFNNNGKD